MSKTTGALLSILLIVIGVLLYIEYRPKQNLFISSLTQPSIAPTYPSDITLSLSTSTTSVQKGQTFTIAVLIHTDSSSLQPDLAQFELSYDPQTVTIDSVSPGTFFAHPSVSLQTIDPVAGRITYALHCATQPLSHCINTSSKTLATITATSSPNAIKNVTSFSFLPKTVVRIHTGKNVLKSTKGIQLTIGNVFIPIATSSAIASPGANFIPAAHTH